MRRATASSRPTACSAAEMMLDVGALTTSTPCSVAAGTSTLSRPTPARATTLSLPVAAKTSASTWVAERTSSASASATADSRAGRSVPSTWRISTSSPNTSMTDGASFSAIRTTGRLALVTTLLQVFGARLSRTAHRHLVVLDLVASYELAAPMEEVMLTSP